MNEKNKKNSNNRNQAWNASLYDSHIGFVSEYGKSVLELLNVREGEKVLDIGCGTGDLCAELAKRGALPYGIDASADMIARANEKYPALAFETADAHTYRSDIRYDAVFSNAALHWMKRPGDAIRTVRSALKPGGRFVAEFGGKGNVGAIVEGVTAALSAFGIDAASRHPWYFPSAGEYASLLEAEGFRLEYALHYSRPTPLEDGERGLDHWLDMFAGSFFTGLTEERKRQAYEEAKRIAAPKLYRDGRWIADYWRLRIIAFAPQNE